jgi:hypothetical protein
LNWFHEISIWSLMIEQELAAAENTPVQVFD